MNKIPGWAGAVFAALVVLGLTALFDRLEHDRFQAEQRGRVLDRLSAQRATLEANLSARLYMVRALAAFVQTGDPVTEERFAAFAAHLVGDRKGIRALDLAPDCIIRHVYPLETNIGAIGTDLLAVPRFQESIRRTIEGNTLTVAGPTDLVQGGAGLLGRIPIFVESNGIRTLWGLAIIVLDLPMLLAEAGVDDHTHLEYAIRGRDGLGARGEMFYGDPALFRTHPVVLDVSVPNGTWQIAAIPAGGWAKDSPRRLWLLLSGGLVAVLVGLVTHGLLLQSARLRKAVGESRASEVRLRDAVDCLAASNTELERFAYVASHDLQEPLRTITSFAQLLERRGHARLEAEDLDYLNFIVGGAKRMHALVNDLLTYSRVTHRGEPFAPVDCGDLIAKVLQNLHDSLTQSGARVTVAEQLPPVQGDYMQLLQLFQNLISNAVKFRRDGVVPCVVIAARAAPDGVEFSVADNGIGIEEEFRDLIFSAFKRLHPQDRYPGTGVGLAICKRILDRHGGRIWVDTGEGGGSVFHFTLPRAVGAQIVSAPLVTKAANDYHP